jgi:hypothetical protein
LLRLRTHNDEDHGQGLRSLNSSEVSLNVELVLARNAHHQMAEADWSLAPCPRPVRTEMRKPRHLALKIAGLDRPAVKSKYPADAAHEALLPFPSSQWVISDIPGRMAMRDA